MGRRQRRIRANRVRRNIDLAEIFQWIETSNTPRGGWDYADPIEIEIARERIRVAKKVAQRVYNLQNTANNFQRRPDGQLSQQEKQRIFHEGYRAANDELRRQQEELDAYRHNLELEAARIQRQPKHLEMASVQQLERARMQGYAQGVVAGRAIAAQENARPTQIRPEDTTAIRNKMQKEMLEQCRIISESNPGMAPGVNAVRHLIRKLV